MILAGDKLARFLQYYIDMEVGLGGSARWEVHPPLNLEL